MTTLTRSTYAVRAETKTKIEQMVADLKLASVADLFYLLADSAQAKTAQQALAPLALLYMGDKMAAADRVRAQRERDKLERRLAELQPEQPTPEGNP